MMAALLQELLGSAVVVESAGISVDATNQRANAVSVALMSERGIDLSEHEGRCVNNLDPGDYSHVVCVQAAAELYVMELFGEVDTKFIVANKEGGGIPNPYKMGEAAHRKCLALLDVVLRDIAKTILVDAARAQQQ